MVVDQEDLRRAQEGFSSFVKASTWGIIGVAALLVLMAIFLL